MVRTPLIRFSLCIALAITAISSWAQGLPAASPESVGMSSERLKRISAALKSEIDKGNLPGAVVMVARKGKLVYSDAIGFQDKAAGTPMRAPFSGSIRRRNWSPYS